MTDIVKIDPFLYGYFLDETLEHGERVGLALLYAAKNIEIRFSRRLLLETAFETKYGTAAYTPSEGLRFCNENIMKLAEDFPEHKETFKRYIDELNILRDKAKRLYSEPTEALDRSSAEWGGGQQYTVTVVSPEDLIDAKSNPDNHRNLIVRVGGYSDYFVNLDVALQDNVIERTFTGI